MLLGETNTLGSLLGIGQRNKIKQKGERARASNVTKKAIATTRKERKNSDNPFADEQPD